MTPKTALRDIREFLWPALEPLSAEQQQAKNSRDEQNGNFIRSLKPKKQASVALDEARRLNDVENERRRSADQKATTYLAFVGAILPLILTLTTAFWDKKASNVPLWFNSALLIIAIAYTLRAGKLAFDVLKVKVSHRLGASDFDEAWKQTDPTTHLTRSILQTIRLNEDGTNEKVSTIKMTHAFLFRAFLAFSSLLVVNIIWPILEPFWSRREPWLASSGSMLQAIREIDKFDRSVLSEGTTRQSLAEWCGQHGLGGLSSVSVKPTGLPVSLLPMSVKRLTKAKRPDAEAIIMCGRTELAVGQIWIFSREQTVKIDPISLLYRGELGEFGLSPSDWQSRSYWPHTLGSGGHMELPPVLLTETFQTGIADQRPIALVNVQYRKSILQFGPDFVHGK